QRRRQHERRGKLRLQTAVNVAVPRTEFGCELKGYHGKPASHGVLFSVLLTDRDGAGVRGFVIKDIDGYGLFFVDFNKLLQLPAFLLEHKGLIFPSEFGFFIPCLPSKQRVAGSSPAGRTFSTSCSLSITPQNPL